MACGHKMPKTVGKYSIKDGEQIIIDDELRINSELVTALECIVDMGIGHAKDILAQNLFFVMSLPGENEQISREFYELQLNLWFVLDALHMSINGKVELCEFI